ncbi:MAG: hypothetical protein AAFR64_08100 [Pseudomonadota bacterium]
MNGKGPERNGLERNGPVSKRMFLGWWINGIVAFVIALILHNPLVIEAVPGGILDHQSAPDAASVDAIQTAWQAAGLMDQASIAMSADLIFIGLFGVGVVLGGLYFGAKDARGLKVLGWIALVSGIVFLATDYSETIAQYMQLSRMAGDDGFAALASSMGPLKVASFLVAFVALIVALIWKRLSQPSI